MSRTSSPEGEQSLDDITPMEMALIRRMRSLQQRRNEHRHIPGRPEPLGMITYESHTYLEIRPGYTPILVPAHLDSVVRGFLSQFFPPYLRSVRQLMQAQAPSPLHSPMLPPSTAVSSTMHSPHLAPMGTPPLSPGAPFVHNLTAPPLLPSYSAASLAPQPALPSPEYVTAENEDDTVVPTLPSDTAPLNFSMPNLASIMSAAASQAGIPQQVSQLENIAEDHLASTSATSNTTQTSSSQEPGDTNGTSAAKSKAGKDRPTPAKKKRAPAYPRKRSPSVATEKKHSDAQQASAPSPRAAMSGGIAADGDKNGRMGADSDGGEEQLRKPANAFILYRKERNRKLRAEQPGISVEAASAIIGKCWREESPEVKQQFQEQARQERDKYFAKKKELQARQRRRRSEKEDPQGAVSPPQAGRARRCPSESEAMCRMVFSESQKLSSLTPDGLLAVSGSRSASPNIPPLALPRPPRHTRSLTMPSQGTPPVFSSSLGRISTSMGLGAGSAGVEADPYAAIESSVPLTSIPAEISQQVALSLEQLRTQSASALPPPLGLSMELSAPMSPAAVVQPFPIPCTTTDLALAMTAATSSAMDVAAPVTTSANGTIVSSASFDGDSDWSPSTPAAAGNGWSDMLGSLFTGSS